MSLHVYTATIQPLTCYADYCGSGVDFRVGYTVTHPPRALRYCRECWRRRWAAKLSVQVYYDDLRIFCTDQRDCDVARKARRRTRR